MSIGRLTKQIFDFIRVNEQNLVDIEKKRISVESKDILGSPIGFYSAKTEDISGGRKKEGEPFTGKDSGDWFKGFYVEIKGDTFTFGSSDPKSSSILRSESWLSDKLFGLTDKELEEVVSNEMLPFFIISVRKMLGI